MKRDHLVFYTVKKIQCAMVFYNISKNLVIHFLTWKGMKIEFNVWLLNLFNIALCFHIICLDV